MKELITIDEAAKALEVSRRTFDNWRYKPGFPKPTKYTQRTIRFDRAEILRWKEKPTA